MSYCLQVREWSEGEVLSFLCTQKYIFCSVVLQLAGRQMTSSAGWRSAQAQPSPPWPESQRPNLWSPTTRLQSLDSLRYDSDLSRPEQRKFSIHTSVFFVESWFLFILYTLLQSVTVPCAYIIGSFALFVLLKNFSFFLTCRMLNLTMPRPTQKQLKP